MKTYEELQQLTSDIPSNYHDGTFLMLYKYIPILPKGEFVEFGTGLGKSVIFNALLNPLLSITTFDTAIPYRIEGYNERIEDTFRKHGVSDIAHFIADSLIVPWSKELVGMYLDSGHQYELTLKEMERWIPFVKQHGIIILDDYLDNRVEVKKAADEYIEKNKDKVKVLEDKYMGLVLQKL
jgi:hypothetical protein